MPTRPDRKKPTPPRSEEPYDIYIVGLGIVGVRHVTREAEQCLAQCREVLFVDHGVGIGEYLRSLGPRASGLLAEYREGESRLETYRSMATQVIDAALERGPVGFATYGHPMMYVYPTILIRKAAEALGLRVRVVAGISIFDTVLVDLGLDPGLTGLQMYEATSLLIEERQLLPDVPCLILQVDTVESALFTRDRNSPKRFERLKTHLLRFYPEDHPMVSVYSSTFPLMNPILDTFALRDLPERCARGTSGTVYIPPVRMPRRANSELEKRIYDPEHLSSVTRPRKPSTSRPTR